MNDKSKRNFAHIGFFSALVVLVLAVSLVPMPEWYVLLALPFASSLGARAVAYLDIFEWLRQPFTKVIQHSSGVGNNVEPVNGSVIGGLLSCVNCAGMWSSVLLLLVHAVLPGFGSILIITLGATSIGILFTRTIEMVEWKACLAQEQTGELNRTNKIVTRRPMLADNIMLFAEEMITEEINAKQHQTLSEEGLTRNLSTGHSPS